MTPQQLKVLHTHRRKLEEGSGGHFTRADFNLVLLNLGGVRPDADGAISSKRLTHAGFERVMAFLEDNLARVDARTGTYWRDRDRRRGQYLTSRQEWEIHRQFEQLLTAGVTYQLAGLVSTQSGGRTGSIRELSPYEAEGLIEMLKSLSDRTGKTETDTGRKYVPVDRQRVAVVTSGGPSLFQ